MLAKLLPTTAARMAIAAATFASITIPILASAQGMSADQPRAPRNDRTDAKAAERARNGADALTNAKVLLAAHDSAAALKMLQSATQKDQENGPLWFALAELLVERNRPSWNKNIKTNDNVATTTRAHEAFENAMHLSPDSIRYGVAYSSFMWNSRTDAATRSGRLRYDLNDRLAGSSDSLSIAIISNQIGMMMWHGYEPLIGNVRPPHRVEEWLAMRNSDGLMSVGMLDYARRNGNETVNAEFFRTARRYFSMASAAFPIRNSSFVTKRCCSSPQIAGRKPRISLRSAFRFARNNRGRG